MHACLRHGLAPRKARPAEVGSRDPNLQERSALRLCHHCGYESNCLPRHHCGATGPWDMYVPFWWGVAVSVHMGHESRSCSGVPSSVCINIYLHTSAPDSHEHAHPHSRRHRTLSHAHTHTHASHTSHVSGRARHAHGRAHSTLRPSPTTVTLSPHPRAATCRLGSHCC